MNRFAYLTTGFAIRTLSNLSRARIQCHNIANIPLGGALVFVINHFTRIETLFLPYQLFQLTNTPVWSLADANLFRGSLGRFLNYVGAVSTRHPDRDRLIAKSLLTGEAVWVIFPEGRMVKSKKIVEKGRYMISFAGGKHPPHTGAATLALRTEFYRQRLRHLVQTDPHKARQILDRFEIGDPNTVLARNTYIVPVNVTYYPIRARENTLSQLAAHWLENVTDRMLDEIMTEGTMLLSGVDADIRFGQPIEVRPFLNRKAIQADVIGRVEMGFDDQLPSRRQIRQAALKIMQRYMSAIYRMTTVNHDHLFACILKMMPKSKVRASDLRRKVYLAAVRLAQYHHEVHRHQSLHGDQLPLLTDDRYERWRDFLAVAVNKGVLRKQGRILTKDKSKFFSAFDFHRARLDNPIAVIANEVEPLGPLLRRLRWQAWQPNWLTRRKVFQRLITKALSDFEHDYNAFFVQGESKDKAVGRPYLIRGRRHRSGVLLIHGYLAAPPEVQALADYLGDRGYWVYVPRLRGHGTSPDDLATRTYQDWLASVEEGYAILSSLCRHLVVGGMSTGGGLALDLAVRIPSVAGVFAVCPPMRLQDFSAKLVPALDVWNRLMARVNVDGIGKKFVANHPEHPDINYHRNPIAGVRELERLMAALKPKLPEIKIPALVLQADQDPVVHAKGSQELFARLGSADKRYVLFNFDRHGILLGDGAERVHKTIADFIGGLSQAA